MNLSDILAEDVLDRLNQQERESLSRIVDEVFFANILLSNSGLAPLTWGNVSALSDCGRFMVIKPSGVSYEDMVAEDMVILELESFKVISTNNLRPSTDTPTHLFLYKQYPDLKGVCHTHSPYATA